MPIVEIPADRIVDWESFHEVFSQALGFPEFYGRNMNAWVDCLTYREAPGDGMAAVNIAAGDVLTLQVASAMQLRERCPEQYAALVECSAFVNWRGIEAGERPILVLSFRP